MTELYTRIPSDMRWPLYLRLVLLTAGTLLPFFWLVVILGHRRQRNFERLFFFLCLALTCFFGSSLLALNAQLYFGSASGGLAVFAWTFLTLGLWFIPPLVLHLHVEYASIREQISSTRRKRAWLALAWAPALLLSPFLLAALRIRRDYEFESPSHSLGRPYQAWLVAAIAVGGFWQWKFAKSAPDEDQKSFHNALLWDLELVALLFSTAFLSGAVNFSLLAMGFALFPLVGLIGKVQRLNFLQIGRQRNLIYAVFVTFVALLYLSFVRRASLWLDGTMPPEATAALLLFLPVVFFEPLQRVMRRLLQQTAQSEMDRAQKLMGPINEVARLGNLDNLRKFGERWIGEQLQMAEVRLLIDGEGKESGFVTGEHAGAEESFAVQRGGRRFGTLRVRAHGAMISGETYAALEFVCEQLPAAFDLCRLIEEKLELERELAERERLALVGQTAASISHNLKNPLGSIKTILQVQLESAELPESMRGETRMILEEINRLSAKLNQLLQFSRPAVRGAKRSAFCNARTVVEEVAGIFRSQAEQRGIALKLCLAEDGVNVAIPAESLHDIVSNLLTNALEACPGGGSVSVRAKKQGEAVLLEMEDDGPGIPESLREKVVQPFFTTKSQGTGLGLAIVARRVAECGGTLDWLSPVNDGRGTRFQVTLPFEREVR